MAVGILPPGHVYNCAKICTAEESAEGGGARLRRRDITYALCLGPEDSMRQHWWDCELSMQML